MGKGKEAGRAQEQVRAALANKCHYNSIKKSRSLPTQRHSWLYEALTVFTCDKIISSELTSQLTLSDWSIDWLASPIPHSPKILFRMARVKVPVPHSDCLS